MDREYLKKYIICYHIPPLITLGLLFVLAIIFSFFSIEPNTILLGILCTIIGLLLFLKVGRKRKVANLVVYISNLVLYACIILLVLGIKVLETKQIIYLVVVSIMVILLNIFYRNDLFEGDKK